MQTVVDANTFKQLALSFNGTEPLPHFNRTAFKIAGRRIFATLLEEERTANIFLSPAEQKIYAAHNDAAVYPIPNKWGLQGWTTFKLANVPVELVSDALLSAYSHVLQRPQTKNKKK